MNLKITYMYFDILQNKMLWNVIEIYLYTFKIERNSLTKVVK